MNNIYQLFFAESLAAGIDSISVNGRPLQPAPVEAGNLWQRFIYVITRHEYGGHPPVNSLLLSRYARLQDGEGVILTGADIAGVVDRVVAQLGNADESHLVNAISDLDYPLVEGLLAAGITPGKASLAALVAVYQSYKVSQTRPRSEVLGRLLRSGAVDPCARVEGKNLLHHLCAGTASTAELRLLIEGGGHRAISDQNQDGDTPLLCYCRRRRDVLPPNRPGLDLLVESGADVNASNRGVTAYTLLVRAGCQQLVERVLEYGAEPVH